VGCEASVCRLPCGLRSEKLRHVRFGAAFLLAIEFCRCLVANEIGGFDIGVSSSDRKLNSLIRSDRATEDNPLGGVLCCPFDKPAAVPDRLGRNKNALGIPAVDDIAKAHSLLANQILSRNFNSVEKKRSGVMVYHEIEWLNFEFSFSFS